MDGGQIDTGANRPERPHRLRSAKAKQPKSRVTLIGFTDVLLAGLVLLVIARTAGVPHVSPIPQIIAFYPLLTLGCLVALFSAYVARHWISMPVAGAIIIAVLAPSFVGNGNPGPSPNGIPMRVVAANVHMGTATGSLIEQLVRNPADLVFVVECTPECRNQLTTGPVSELLPFSTFEALPGASGAGILSRTRLAESTTDSTVSDELPLAMPEARIEIGSTGTWAVVKSAHPFPPIPLELNKWFRGLDQIQDFVTSASGPILIGGDFNATQSHRPFRDILAAGNLIDTASQWHGTWPSDIPRFLAAPIDHVVASRHFAVLGSTTWQLDTSDHQAVVVDLQYRP